MRRAFAGKPVSGWQSSQMHHVSVGRALCKAVPVGSTRSRGRRAWDSAGGFSIPACAGRRMLDVLALLFGSGEVRAGRGHFGSCSSAQYQGHFDGFHSGFPFFSSFSRARFRPGGPPPVRDRQHLRGRPSNSRVQQLEGERGTLLATRSAAVVRAIQLGGKKRGLRCTATLENPADPIIDPFPSAWLLPALASVIVEPDAVQAVHNICCFGPPRWKEQRWVGFLPGLEKFVKRCCCKVPHVPLFSKADTQAAASYPPQLCEAYAKLWLDAMTSRDAELNVLDSSASGGQHGSRVKEAENELHVGGLQRPGQTLYLVPGWETTGRRLWDCIDAALSGDTDASGPTRLYGQADFQGPPSELVEKVRRAIQKEFTLEPVATPRPSYGLPSTVRACILCGVVRAAGDPDTNTLQDWLVQGAPLGMDRRIGTTGVFPPADARQRRLLTNPRCVRATHSGMGASQIRAREPPKMRTKNSNGIVLLTSLWTPIEPRSSVSSRKVT